MKTWMLLFLILLGFFVYYRLNAGKKPDSQSAAVRVETHWETITAAEVHSQLEQEIQVSLVDVRTLKEYREGHLPQSISIPLNALASVVPARFRNKNEEIIVYCRTGARSEMAAKTLAELGYTRVYDLGGIVNWPYALEK